jgi:hypothetical protein
MKKIIFSAVCLLTAGLLFAQETPAPQTTEVGAPDASKIGTSTAQQTLKEISVDKFEVEGFWKAAISSDEGIAMARLREGSPEGKQPIPEESSLNIPDQYVLGVRTDFYHRGPASIKILADHPIPIEGVTKTLSVWAAGRNFNHELYILIKDYDGQQFALNMGSLNFQGWQQLSVAVPPQNDDGTGGIKQQDYHFNNEMGIQIVGFEIRCDLEETYGTYYIYLDDLRAVTDLFLEDNKDANDMSDGW